MTREQAAQRVKAQKDCLLKNGKGLTEKQVETIFDGIQRYNRRAG
jgi:hypothetical protein